MEYERCSICDKCFSHKNMNNYIDKRDSGAWIYPVRACKVCGYKISNPMNFPVLIGMAFVAFLVGLIIFGLYAATNVGFITFAIVFVIDILDRHFYIKKLVSDNNE